jgi:hypothetical protein
MIVMAESITIQETDENKKRLIAARLMEIEKAIKDKFTVEDPEDKNYVLLATEDMPSGEAMPVLKEDCAAMFVEAPEVYAVWKKAYDEFLDNKTKGQVLFKERFGRFRNRRNNKK